MFHSIYPEWHEFDDDRLAEVLKTATIALDANVLLSLYRISSSARENVLKILGHDTVRARLFIPYQVGLEYLRNRVDVARSASSGYGDLRRAIEAHKQSLAGQINDGSRGIRDKDVQSELNDAVIKHLDELTTAVTEVQSRHVIDYSEFRTADPVKQRLEQIFTLEGQIATKPDASTLEQRKKKAKERYSAKIPPGYEDATGTKAKEDPSGDFLVWCELLDHAAASSSPLLFVTDDRKADWYQLDKQKQIQGPRPELRLEMDPHVYHQTTLEGFLRLVDAHLPIEVEAGTVEQVTGPNASQLALDLARKFLEQSPSRSASSAPSVALYRPIDRVDRYQHALQIAREILGDEVSDDKQAMEELAKERAWERYYAVRDAKTEDDLDYDGQH